MNAINRAKGEEIQMKKPVLLDGAVGTSLWELAEANGVEKVPVWRYNLEHPEFVRTLCRRYADAGAQIILANTFGANGPSVKRASDTSAAEVVAAGVRIAKEALAGTGRKVAVSAGPLTQLVEPWGDMSVQEAQAIYEEQIGAGVDAGADLILLQTFIDLHLMEIATRVAVRYGLPVFCAMTFEKVGKTMFGNSVQDVIDALTPLGVAAVGMNCSLGPDLALPVIREFAEKTDLPLVFKPNAGKPILAADGSTVADYDAETFVREVAPALAFVDYIGGCCGSNPEYIRLLKQRIDAEG